MSADKNTDPATHSGQKNKRPSSSTANAEINFNRSKKYKEMSSAEKQALLLQRRTRELDSRRRLLEICVVANVVNSIYSPSNSTFQRNSPLIIREPCVTSKEEGKYFHKTIYVEKERHQIPYIDIPIRLWEVELDDELRRLLPPSTMHLNLFCDLKFEWDWLIKFTTHCQAWLQSIALNSDGLCKEGRTLLFEEINKLPSIRDVVCSTVARMKVKPNNPEEGDEDEEINEDDVLCYTCRDDASCAFWTWCDTCKEDTYQGYCNLCCEHPEDKCKSCSKNFTQFVRRSDNFTYDKLTWP